MKNIDWEATNPLHGNVNYYKELTDIAKRNRKNQTPSEKKLWDEVLRYKNLGFKFVRQKPIYRYIVDFYCAELSLAIEVDGGSHRGKSGFDKYRDQFLKQIGITTLRFTDDEVMKNIQAVKRKIRVFCTASPVKGRCPDKSGRRG